MLASSNSVEICRFHLLRRFWNQIFTCVSLSLRAWASEARSDDDKYRFMSKAVSSWYTWRRENTVRVFFFLDFWSPPWSFGDDAGEMKSVSAVSWTALSGEGEDSLQRISVNEKRLSNFVYLCGFFMGLGWCWWRVRPKRQSHLYSVVLEFVLCYSISIR